MSVLAEASASGARSSGTAVRVAAVAGLALVAVVAFVYWSGRRRKGSTTASQRLRLLARAAAPQLQRQVFLSHTGQDEVARHFTASVLKPALERAGVKVVVDFQFLQPGVDWSQQLVEAAANSAVFVAVLSRTYTRRFWCMLELDLALNAQRLRVAQQQAHGSAELDVPLMIPVFLDVCDTVVQWDRIRQFWSTQPAGWHSREEAGEAGRLGQRARWVDAECWADNMAATLQWQNLRLSEVAGKDALLQLAQRVVQAAVQRLPVQARLHEGPVVVGLEERTAALVAELSGGCLGAWLHGPGGCGKTTLGKRLVNCMLDSGRFQHSAIVEVQHDDGDDKTKLAGHLRGVLKKLTGKEPAGASAAELASELKKKVAKRQMVYMLDNVWTPQQLEHLLPTKWGHGSIIIITSRSTTINCPTLRKMKEQLLFRAVAVLDGDSSRQLFRTCAGLPALGPPAPLLHMEDRLLQRCAGLPLALKIVGGSLHGSTDTLEWQAVLAALTCGAPAGDTAQELAGVVEHSLRGLQPQAVSMFLDVATVLRRTYTAAILPMWEAWHGLGATAWLRDLQQCSLVAVDSVGRLGVHDIVAVLGRRMVLDSSSPFHGSRLWVEDGRVVGFPARGQARGHKVLVAELDVRNKESNFYGGQDLPPLKLDPAASELDWSEAKVLCAGRVQMPMPEGVLWVSVAEWEQLVAGSRAGATVLEHALQLQELHVDDCRNLKVLPAGLARLTNLRQLSLRQCSQLAAVPASLGQLTLLRTLSLAGCIITALPDAVCNLSSLQWLSLDGCSQLAALPDGLGQLTALTHFSVPSCSQLAELPQSAGQLACLRELWLNGCSSITELSDAVCNLSSLQLLVLEGCSQLAALPDGLGQLTALTYLSVASCSQLAVLPQSVGQLACLRELYLTDCSSITELPDTVCNLWSLQKLDLRGCSQLAALQDWISQLASLQRLSLRDCTRLTALPDTFGHFTSLQHLDLYGCSQLTALPDRLGHLARLTALDLDHCSSLAVLPNSIGQLTALRWLDLRSCMHLSALPTTLGQLTQLGHLRLHGCSQLADLPECVGSLTALRVLHLTDCSSLPRLTLRGCEHLLDLAELPEKVQHLLAPSAEEDAGGSDW